MKLTVMGLNFQELVYSAERRQLNASRKGVSVEFCLATFFDSKRDDIIKRWVDLLKTEGR